MPSTKGILVVPEPPFTVCLDLPGVARLSGPNEQPFTRSQSGIVIPESVTEVRMRAHDVVDGCGGCEVHVDLTAPSGLDFAVERRP